MYLKKFLRKFGYELRKIPKNNKPIIQINIEEYKELIKDLNAYSKIDDSSWSNPKVVLSYLCPERISFYHDILAKCSENGVVFDNKIVADFGTCTGYLPRLISQKYKPKKIFGYDYQDIFVKLASHLAPKATIIKHNLLDNLNEKFDIIIISQVLEHLTNPEKVMQNLFEMLNKDGYLIITIPDGRLDTFEAGKGSIEDDSFSGHINFWSVESFELFLRKLYRKDQYAISKINNNIFTLIQNN